MKKVQQCLMLNNAKTATFHQLHLPFAIKLVRTPLVCIIYMKHTTIASQPQHKKPVQVVELHPFHFTFRGRL